MINADPQSFLQMLMEGAEDEEGVPQGSQVIQVLSKLEGSASE